MSRLRWARWFWQDWSDDNALALCSHAAQSIWMRLMCIASQGSDYGSITINGIIPTDEQLAKLIRPAVDVRRFRRLLAELERKNVVSRDVNGTLFCRRMRVELESFSRLSFNGKLGASKRYGIVGYSQKQKQKQKQKQNQIPSHPNPPLRSRGEKGFSHDEILQAVRQGMAEGAPHGTDQPRHLDDAAGGSGATTIAKANGAGTRPHVAIPRRRRGRGVH